MSTELNLGCQCDELHEECGVFGFYDNDGFDVARLTYYGLYALQHRGQESAGIAVNDDGQFLCHKDLGLVPEIFNDLILNNLKGTMAVGHVRYSTKGGNQRENAQPLVNKYVKGTLALAHNGNLINGAKLRNELEKNGAIFHTTIDSEVIMYKLAQERIRSHSIEQAMIRAMDSLEGAYSIVLMSPRKLMGARDPYGFRPLCIGKMKNSYILSSETCALENLGAEFVREHYLATCRRAEKLPTDSKKDARMREMFVLNLDWFMATLLEGSVAQGYRSQSSTPPRYNRSRTENSYSHPCPM